MRKLKWTAAILIVVMIVVVALYMRRDYVARELANSALADTDLEVAELSVNSLGVSRVELSRLVVVSTSGMRFEIRGLSVPLGLSDVEMNEIFAESLNVVFSEDRSERQALSDSVWRMLAMPQEQPNITVSIDAVTLPDVPLIENAVWTTVGDRQNAKLEVDEHAIEIIVDGDEIEGYKFSLLGSAEEIGAELALSAEEDKVILLGDLRVRIEDWLPTLRSMSLVPEEVALLETELSGSITISLDSDGPGDIAVDASLMPVDGANVEYAIADDSNARFDAFGVAMLNVHFDYPDMTWTAASSSVDGLVTIDDGTFPLLLNNLDCQSGIRCTMYATIYGENLSWADYAVDTASISSPIVVETGELTRIDIPSDASVVLTGIRVGEIGASSAEVLSFSGTQVLVAESLQSTVEGLRLAVDGLEVAEALTTSGELGITDLTIADSGETVDAQIVLAPGATASWDDMLMSLPGLSGTVTRRGDELRSTLDVQHAAIEAGIDLVRDLDTGAGAVTVRDARISFDFTHLSDYVSDWPFVWDVMSGVLTASASLEWQSTNDEIRYAGIIAADLQKISGVYEDYAVVGVTTALRGSIDSVDGIALEPGSVSIPLIDVGLAAENLSADYEVDIDTRTVMVENLALEALGGSITARPFSYSANADINEIVFDAEAIQLALIAELTEFESLDMSGSISGEIPISIGADSIGVDGGQLASDDPGGVIRYSSSLTEGAAPEGNLAIVTRALSNFEFDTLSSTVDYGDDGELVLTTRLSGINPDADPNQPIILNLNIDTNIPQMLRSLRAIRTIEDILKERTAE